MKSIIKTRIRCINNTLPFYDTRIIWVWRAAVWTFLESLGKGIFGNKKILSFWWICVGVYVGFGV